MCSDLFRVLQLPLLQLQLLINFSRSKFIFQYLDVLKERQTVGFSSGHPEIYKDVFELLLNSRGQITQILRGRYAGI